MTRQILVGGVPVGGGAPVTIQSMTNTRTDDVGATVDQILRLEEAGCQIIRVAVPDLAAAKAVGAIKAGIHIPLVVDIHFDYKLALACVEEGCDAVRINPGNIGGEDRVKAVAEACKARSLPIRIGVNGGSLEKPLLAKYGGVTPEALVESAFGHIALLEQYDFHDICISLKSSSVVTTMAAYKLMSEKSDYPLHLGVTETGTTRMGTIKSAIGIGGLLALDIGDTLRVSLSADPVEEVYAAKDILKALGMVANEPNLVSCPTCGRTRIDLIGLAHQVEERLKEVHKPITVAVMGCVVNGPGEASAADVGIAGGQGEGLLFRKGEIVKKVPQEQLVDELFTLIDQL
ncbi:MAG: flavodoxin-dependent (E)-4-hydroxy-3-methylbut-2-enyl-diphosphate synthase [Clostridiales bacterium]|uniref:flavodoxin-dependent (E)-4-hydroxy-3-methylbut-2-enyl-diphosphate synthase n=1 Tax=Flavonifractor porci TaxID=3133422 RepID=UPI00309F9365|nr:flavodoxin-dependent (E)-4-hydroxy-3-methylbut-2-enyl-diphosphate synthase [Clostridiales bacterium]